MPNVNHWYSPFFNYFSPLLVLETSEEFVNFLNKTPIENWKQIKQMLSSHLKKLNNEQKSCLIKQIIEIGFEKNPYQTLIFLNECLTLSDLEQLVSDLNKMEDSRWTFDNFVKSTSTYNKKPFFLPKSHSAVRQWIKFRPIIMDTIPNLLNIFLETFNMLNPQTKYTSSWDIYLAVNIIKNFVILPCLIAKGIEPYIKNILKSYVIAVCILFSLGVLVSLYLKWLRPIPKRFVNCINLEDQVALGLTETCVGFEDLIEKIKIDLKMKSTICLVGPTGMGKSTLIDHMVQTEVWNKNISPADKLSFHSMRCDQFVTCSMNDAGDMLLRTKQQIQGFNVVLVCEEFSQMASNLKVLQSFKTQLMVDKSAPSLIILLSDKEYEDVKNLLNENWEAYDRRLRVIDLKEKNEDSRFIDDIIIAKIEDQKDVSVHSDIPRLSAKIRKIVTNKTYFPDRGIPSKVNDLLLEARLECLYGLKLEPFAKEILELENKKTKLFIEKPDLNPAEAYTLINEIDEEIRKIKEKQKKIQIQIEEIKKIFAFQVQLKVQFSQITQEIKNNKITEQNKKMYVLYEFFARTFIQDLIQKKIDQVQQEGQIAVQISADLIKKLYQKNKPSIKNENRSD